MTDFDETFRSQLLVGDRHRRSRNPEVICQASGGRQLTAGFIDAAEDLLAKSLVDLARTHRVRATGSTGT
ncbi:hypothetical protein MEA186_10966 [Mesorhizobium amorphae CCNWGS0123]|uniref:Uncharacterized protein n=1 Tax=Mesorhizobium amorphae CCNWGS0123 TaxID=1082933 RepID=G6Y8C6_9HYPH|nr:hypothetical protein MEA186_10966 [Mesorhizobium amorphae CCNWGS0123]